MKVGILIANTPLFGCPWGTSCIARMTSAVGEQTREVRVPMLGVGGIYETLFARVSSTPDVSVFREEAAG